jgi:septal ring factor EnvC (AmiA/AmiB activator)
MLSRALPVRRMRTRAGLPRLVAAGLVACGCALAPGAAHAQEASPAERLDELQRAIDAEAAEAEAAAARADAYEAEAERLRQESIAAAARAQALEADLGEAEMALAFRRLAEMRQRRRLAERDAELASLLGALQRIALQPPEALLTAPGGALETARSAMLLSSTVPELERRAEAVRVEVQRLAALTAATATQRDALADTRASLTAQQERLQALARQKIDLRQEALSDRTAAEARLQALADEAEDVQALLQKLQEERAARRAREAEAALAALQRAETLRREGRAVLEERRAEPADDVARAVEAPVAAASAPAPQVAALPAQPLAKPGSVRPFPSQRRSLRLPVAGSVTVGFGERLSDGIDARARGLYMESRPGAQVVAPFDGQVAFAGRFRRYGLLLIIEHDGRYHSLLSGLERIDAVVGQWVLAGEPVGAMSARESGATPRLYYELRRDSQPIDPLPWLAMDEERARG